MPVRRCHRQRMQMRPSLLCRAGKRESKSQYCCGHLISSPPVNTRRHNCLENYNESDSIECALLLPTVRIRSPEHKQGLPGFPTHLMSTRETSRIGTGSGLRSEIMFFQLSCHAHKIISLTRHSFRIHAGFQPATSRPETGRSATGANGSGEECCLCLSINLG